MILQELRIYVSTYFVLRTRLQVFQKGKGKAKGKLFQHLPGIIIVTEVSNLDKLTYFLVSS